VQNPTVVPVDGTTIVRIVVQEQRLDSYAAPALRDVTTQLISELKFRQILDLDGVKGADSTGLAVIYGSEKRAWKHGGALVLVNVGVDLAHTLRITGLDKIVTIASDLDSAIAYFTPPEDAAALLARDEA
jgi:anti-anti-sigma factor